MCLLNFQNYFRNVPKTNAIITCRMVPLFHLISRGLPGSIRMESVKWLSIGPINQVSSKISLFIGCIFVRIVFFLSFAILSSPERFDQSEYISEHSWLLSNFSPYQTNLDKFDHSIWKQRLFDKMVVMLSSYRVHVTTCTCRYVPVCIIYFTFRAEIVWI